MSLYLGPRTGPGDSRDGYRPRSGTNWVAEWCHSIHSIGIEVISQDNLGSDCCTHVLQLNPRFQL